jgi:hypothetical protein
MASFRWRTCSAMNGSATNPMSSSPGREKRSRRSVHGLRQGENESLTKREAIPF